MERWVGCLFSHQQYLGWLMRPKPASSWNIRRTFPQPLWRFFQTTVVIFYVFGASSPPPSWVWGCSLPCLLLSHVGGKHENCPLGGLGRLLSVRRPSQFFHKLTFLGPGLKKGKVSQLLPQSSYYGDYRHMIPRDCFQSMIRYFATSWLT